MPIEFACTGCGQTLRAGDEAAGKRVRCGGCAVVVTVPAAPPPPAPPPPAPPGAADIASPAERWPEPKRRRPRGKAFWVAAVALTVVVAGGLIWAAVWYVSVPRWRPHEAADGGFKVDVPAAPRAARIEPEGVPARGIEARLYLPLEEYVVAFAELPAHRRWNVPEDELFADSVAGMLAAAPGSAVTRIETTVVSGFPAREVILTDPRRGSVLARLVLAETRAYVVLAAGRDPANPRFRRFVESFEVTDGLLLARATQRKEGAQRAADAAAAAQRSREAEAAAAAARKEQQEAAARAEQARIAKEKEDAERVRREAEEARVRAAKVAFDRAVGEARTAAAAFAAAAWAGPPVPDPKAVPALKLHLSFDGSDPRVVAVRPSGETIRPTWAATAGPGVRGAAPLLPFTSPPVSLPPAALPTAVLTGDNATVAAWVRVRGAATVTPFALGPLGNPALRLTLSSTRGEVAAAARGAAAKTVEFVAPWRADEAWHHVAVVRRVVDKTTEYRVYLDGAAVQAGTTPPPVGKAARDGPVPETEVWVGEVAGAVRELSGVTAPGTDPRRDLPKAAIDEVCVFDEALSEKAVRFLAGRDKELAADQAFMPWPAPPPMPTRGRYAGPPVPAPGEFAGLRVHLPFDDTDDGRVKEAVSGAWVGKLNPLSRRTDGVRGGGVRLVSGGTWAWDPPGLELDPALFRVAAGKPFTLGIWVRPPDAQVRQRATLFHAERKDENPFLGRDLTITVNDPTLSATRRGYASLHMDENDPSNAARQFLKANNQAYFTGWPGWHHVALTRDDKGVIRWVVDGVPSRKLKDDVYPGVLDFTAVKLAEAGDASLDVDDFCLFDRALTLDELKKLAGLAK